MKTALVVGAGLSGLTAAWFLAERGMGVRVVCADAEPGGLIHTRRTPEGLVETAANSMMVTERASAVCAAIGVELCPPQKASARRFVYRNGRPRRLPLTAFEAMGGVARFAFAAVRGTSKPRAGESVAAWGRRVAGPAVTSHLIGPVLQGIYAAPADRLAARAVFGQRKGRRGGIVSPRRGMGEIIEALVDRLAARGVAVECGVRLDALSPREHTIVATAAPAAARLIASHAPALSAAIARVELSPALTVTAFFDPAPTDLHGFGVLFPRGGDIDALGVLFNADIFPGRSALRSETWILGGGPSMLASDADVLEARVLPDRERLLGATARPRAVHVTRWPHGIPIYDDAVLAVSAVRDSLPPWLGVAGNYLGRIGASALFDVSFEAAARVAS